MCYASVVCMLLIPDGHLHGLVCLVHMFFQFLDQQRQYVPMCLSSVYPHWPFLHPAIPPRKVYLSEGNLALQFPLRLPVDGSGNIQHAPPPILTPPCIAQKLVYMASPDLSIHHHFVGYWPCLLNNLPWNSLRIVTEIPSHDCLTTHKLSVLGLRVVVFILPCLLMGDMLCYGGF